MLERYKRGLRLWHYLRVFFFYKKCNVQNCQIAGILYVGTCAMAYNTAVEIKTQFTNTIKNEMTTNLKTASDTCFVITP